MPDDNNAVVFHADELDAKQLSLAMLRNSPDCVKVLNTSGRVSFMSENGLCAMEIADLSQIVGKTWWDMWPDDQRAALQEAFARALDGQISTYWGTCPTATGTPKDWDIRITPISNDDGTISSVLAVSRDVTPPQ